MPGGQGGFSVKKLSAPALAASAALGLDGIKRESKLAFACEVSIETDDGEQTAWALIDSGAEKTFVSQNWVKQHLPHANAGPSKPVIAMDGHTVYSYGSHELDSELRDSRGIVRSHVLSCEAVKMTGYDLIIGFDWLEAVNPEIDWKTRAWYYRPSSEKIEKITAAAFMQEILCGALTLAVYPHLIAKGKPIPLFAAVQGAEKALPIQYLDWADVFDPVNAGKLPESNEYDHAIDTEAGKQIPHKPIYPLSEKELAVLRDYIKECLEKGWIRPSQSPAGAPILFVPKKDGGLRLCVDYRGLNALTLKNRYPLPLIGETMDRLSGAKIFTQLDLKDAYHRIRIRKGDEWKTAFRTRYGHFEYTVMPFGLANAPATFQSYINRAMSDLLDVCCVVYLDDILIYSQTEEQHVRDVRKVLDRLRAYKLYAKMSKCAFHTKLVAFLGFLITPEGVSMEPERIRTILEWPEPQCLYDVQQFIGFGNFYRRFIENYSRVAAPLSELTKGAPKKKGANHQKNGFVFPPEARAAFEELKKRFSSAPVLVHFDPAKPIRIEPDASGFAVAAIATQPDNEGRWHPIAFWSRKMIGAETRYETHDSELLAIVESFKHWRHYLEGSKFPVLVLSDHANLRYFMTTKELTRRQARWAERLAAFDFVIEHRPGTLNPADAPSRRPDYAPKEGEFMENSLLPTLQEKLRKSLGDDEEAVRRAHSALVQGYAAMPTPKSCISTMVGNMTLTPKSDCPHSVAEDCDDAACDAHDMSIVDEWCAAGDTGILDPLVPRLMAAQASQGETAYTLVLKNSMVELLRMTQDRDPTSQDIRTKIEEEGIGGKKLSNTPWGLTPDGLLRFSDRVYVPKETAILHEIMKTHHDDPQGGHYAGKRTLDAIRRKFYWHGIAKDVREYVRNCVSCQRNSVRRHKPYGLLQPLPVPERPGEWLSMDFITGMPPSRWNGKVYDAVLVLVDMFTKYTLYLPCTKEIDAPEFAELLYERMIPIFGMPENLVSDRGSLFTSQFWSSFCYFLAVKRRLSTAFHPQTDGQTERQNQVLEYFLRSYVNWEQDDWARWLPIAAFTYNTTTHSATGKSPCEALMGYNPSIQDSVKEYPQEYHADAAQRVQEIQEMRSFMKERLAKAKESMKHHADKNRIDKSFKVGDWVYLKSKNVETGRPSNKLDHKMLGPFQILEKIGTQAYKLRLTPRFRLLHPTHHVSALELHYGDAPTEDGAPGPIEIDDHVEYEIERILSHRGEKTKSYLVKWRGYDDVEATWEPQSAVEDTQALDEYESRLATAAKTPKKTRIAKTLAKRKKT